MEFECDWTGVNARGARFQRVDFPLPAAFAQAAGPVGYNHGTWCVLKDALFLQVEVLSG
jgi:hypothetical protein